MGRLLMGGARGHYQTHYGYRATAGWGTGTGLSDYAEGDVVDIAADAPAFNGRIPHGWSRVPELCQRPGRYRVVSVFSIGEGPEWYYRVCPMSKSRNGRWKTHWGAGSDRLHVIPGVCDYTEGWTLVESADPERAEVAARRRAAFAVAAASFAGRPWSTAGGCGA